MLNLDAALHCAHATPVGPDDPARQRTAPAVQPARWRRRPTVERDFGCSRRSSTGGLASLNSIGEAGVEMLDFIELHWCGLRPVTGRFPRTRSNRGETPCQQWATGPGRHQCSCAGPRRRAGLVQRGLAINPRHRRQRTAAVRMCRPRRRDRRRRGRTTTPDLLGDHLVRRDIRRELGLAAPDGRASGPGSRDQRGIRQPAGRAAAAVRISKVAGTVTSGRKSRPLACIQT